MSGGSSAGTLTGTATNITSVSVFGGTGNDLLDASGMTMPVTLDGGPPVVVNGVLTHYPNETSSVSGANTLIGGAGDDVLYYSPNTSYDGGGGTNNQIVYQAAGNTVEILTRSFEV